MNGLTFQNARQKQYFEGEDTHSDKRGECFGTKSLPVRTGTTLTVHTAHNSQSSGLLNRVTCSLMGKVRAILTTVNMAQYYRGKALNYVA